ncbi:MAG: hypothetical protein C5S41_00370, partial [Candidatus Methanomarinus sp.]
MKEVALSRSMVEYFNDLEDKLQSAITIARAARSKGFDP